MAYLLDTNVISELRKPKPHGAVVAWIQAIPEQALFVAAITIGEIQAGIEIIRIRDSAKAAQIEGWSNELVRAQQIIPADAAVFRCWARLMHGRPDHHLEDALIAATALTHDLTVATRNTKDFAPFEVRLFNPFM
ncbi:MAG: type II toxin-antitoxin system VapC family toxin [Wenzhouxiangella sp.]|jgi:predicted nucleic acid-binding protein|nr:type II toxin-antitoxin system VapC family toxin [Wenzhouxiangella sp.]